MILFHPKPAHPPIVPCMRSLTDRMAEDMREMAFAGETINPETLRQRGYSDAAIKRLGQAAARTARRRSIRQTAEA
jgi:hypothetical protein